MTDKEIGAMMSRCARCGGTLEKDYMTLCYDCNEWLNETVVKEEERKVRALERAIKLNSYGSACVSCKKFLVAEQDCEFYQCSVSGNSASGQLFENWEFDYEKYAEGEDD